MTWGLKIAEAKVLPPSFCHLPEFEMEAFWKNRRKDSGTNPPFQTQGELLDYPMLAQYVEACAHPAWAAL